jgi:hypothetical protein
MAVVQDKGRVVHLVEGRRRAAAEREMKGGEQLLDGQRWTHRLHCACQVVERREGDPFR